jgi:SAM-dependent methyltransferase
MANRAISDNVSLERWREAQAWERGHWVNAQKLRARYFKNAVWRLLSAARLVPKYRGDDWNTWWKRQFDDYRFLPSEVENAIEVGCGPYTNVRLMLERCRIHHLVLSDPLIRTYVQFKLTLVTELYRQAGCVLDDHPLESLPFASNYFDLAVKINVLDHVQDAHKCMENLVNVVRPGGLLIIGQDLTNEADLKVLKNDAGAVGHPIKLDHEWFEPFLEGFEPLIKRVLGREQGREPSYHYGTLIFAGRKK